MTDQPQQQSGGTTQTQGGLVRPPRGVKLFAVDGTYIGKFKLSPFIGEGFPASVRWMDGFYVRRRGHCDCYDQLPAPSFVEPFVEPSAEPLAEPSAEPTKA